MPSGGKLTVVTRMSDMFTSVQADGRKHRLLVVKGLRNRRELEYSASGIMGGQYRPST